MSGDLFGPLAAGDDLLAATSGAAWVQAMLDAEAALALASADVGVLTTGVADEIAAACATLEVDPAELGRAGRGGGNPVIPLVAVLRGSLAEPGASWVHWGATSQDILDTAAALVACRAGRMVGAHLDRLADGCADLAERHRDTLTVARTLLQPALPTTFGAKAAGWLVGTLQARRQVAEATARLPASLGGAGGTLAAFGHDGPAVAARFATRLDLPAALVPWHTARQPVAALGSALAVTTATAAKVTGDVALLMQAEVAEASEPPGRGGSSTLPQKRNPIAATLVDAAARRAAPLAATLAASVVAQHERPAGAWHAEWQPLAELLQLAGGAAAEAAGVVTGLEVHPATMRANLVRLDGPLLAERVVLTLTPLIGREAATAAVAGAAAVAAGGTASFADALGLDGRVRAVLPPAEIARLLDPSGYLGSAGQWVDRALAAYRGEVPVP